MGVPKTPYFCYDNMLCIIDNLNKELVYGITIDSNVLGYVVVQKHAFLPNCCLFFFKG